MGIALQQQGVDFLILEKAADVGGVWRDNSYPGCTCDVPAYLYSFSFEPKPDWTDVVAPQPELWDYLRGVTDKYGLRGLHNKLAGSVWNTGGCRSYYLDENGYNHTTWSGCTWQYRLATRKLNPSEYRFWGALRHENTTCCGPGRCRPPGVVSWHASRPSEMGGL